ncbi:hypothetical protein [Rufibacter sp. LB8]|uniref:hypothetical protein n=1 Tax=Rufibacter sp. LB8 TaxID=2777781 RepID=UPI00178C7085|nr:hypothetical protein [Rufibacter sp. LB8]
MDLRKLRLGHYEAIILSEFFGEDSYGDFHKIGEQNFAKSVAVDFSKRQFLDVDLLKGEIPEVINFLHSKNQVYKEMDYNSRPIWFRVNFIDQAVKDYVGIGLLPIKSDWLTFLVNSLFLDPAEQGGDSLFTVFDPEFTWAINFELSQQTSALTVRIFAKHFIKKN